MLIVDALLALAGTAAVLVPPLTGHRFLFGLVTLFDLDEEMNVPTYISAVYLLLGAALAAAQAWQATKARSPLRRHWSMLALVLLAMSVDEVCQMHEHLTDVVNHFVPLQGTVLNYAWVVIGVPIVAGLAVYFWPFVRSLSWEQARRFVLAAALFFGGAVGVEIPEGWAAAILGRESISVQMLCVVEETLELVGVSVLVYALLRVLAATAAELRLRFR